MPSVMILRSITIIATPEFYNSDLRSTYIWLSYCTRTLNYNLLGEKKGRKGKKFFIHFTPLCLVFFLFFFFLLHMYLCMYKYST